MIKKKQRKTLGFIELKNICIETGIIKKETMAHNENNFHNNVSVGLYYLEG